jgi:uncharacterized protein (DUF427 family)
MASPPASTRLSGVSDYPKAIVPTDHTEPAPRRVRAWLSGQLVLDTTNALYVWEWPNYPQYYVPLEDVRTEFLVDEDHTQRTHLGQRQTYGLTVGSETRPAAAWVYRESTVPELVDRVRFEWSALDSWFEEDEEVFVHPRSPYSRVDALRSTRTVRIELEGVVLADTTSPVMVFETGLPTRYYLNRTDVDFAHLEASDTVSSCPYKGKTSGYWSIRIGDTLREDLAWAYDFPTRQLLPIAGLIAFYNEKVDVFIDGVLQERPQTHFFK